MKDQVIIDWLACLIIIFAAINVGFIGFFKFNLLWELASNVNGLYRGFQSIIGLAGFWTLYAAYRGYSKNN